MAVLSNIPLTFDTNTIVFTLILLLIILYWQSVRRPAGVPPGPRAYIPWLGNLVDFDQESALDVFKRYRNEYGDIYSLKTGNKLTIVINGYTALKETLVKHGDVFSERPDVFVFQFIGRGKGIIGASGSRWKIHRTFALDTLRGFGFGKRSFESNIMDQVERMMTELNQLHGKTTDISTLIQTCVSNIMCAIVFGHTFKHTDPKFEKVLHKIGEFMKVVGFSGPLNFLPVLRFLPGDPFKARKAVKNITELDELMLEIIQEHEKTFDPTTIRDYIDAFIKEKKKHEETPEMFEDVQLLRSIVDLFLAGTETTATSIRWSLLYFAHYSEIQDRLRQEIHDVIGVSRFPQMEDRPNLHYCEAVLAEVLRCSNIVPLSAPRGVSRETTLLGYRIPKDAIIFPNLDSVLSDPEIYPKPDEFDPSRFIDKDGSFVPKERLLAFSLGRRMCLGEHLAKMEMFLFITSMVQRFKFEPGGEDFPSHKEYIMGSTRTPKPFTIQITKVIN